MKIAIIECFINNKAAKENTTTITHVKIAKEIAKYLGCEYFITEPDISYAATQKWDVIIFTNCSQYGFFEGVFLNNDKFLELNAKINEIAEKKGVTNSAIATAWILRHPAKIQTIVGTTNPQRLRDICKASEVVLTRQEWYELYRAAGNQLP